MNKVFLAAAATSIIIGATADVRAQAWGYYSGGGPAATHYPAARTVVVYPHARYGYSRAYQQQAARWYNAQYGSGTYDNNPYPPSYVYGGYGFGGPASGYRYGTSVYRRDWQQNYQHRHEQPRSEPAPPEPAPAPRQLDDQAVDNLIDNADEATEPKIETYEQYRDATRQRNREAWEKWRAKRGS
jgi:hypothetical protein